MALIVAFVAGTTLGPDLVAAAGKVFDSVLIANTAANPVPVSVQGNLAMTVENFPSTQPVTVENFPSTQPVSGSVTVTGTVSTSVAAPVVVAQGHANLQTDVPTTILPLTDLRAFSEVTLYVTATANSLQNCLVRAAATESAEPISIRAVTNPGNVLTFEPTDGLILDPAPPFISFGCVNTADFAGTTAIYSYMLVGQPR